MVINLVLVDRLPMEPDVESMGRSWYGYDPSCSDVELWAQNRGRYTFKADRIEAERFATLSYRGEIRVVAALTDPVWEPFRDHTRGIVKKALIGKVLGPGDAAYNALIGRLVPPGRSYRYLADDDYGITGVEVTVPFIGTKSHGSAQGWQSDPARRKLVEDAAQDRLMKLYSDEGWEVTDTRFGNPYDAVARRAGEVVFLEAKGTETAGSAVLVSAGEVKHARKYPGRCVMGVLSDIRFGADGQVNADSGTFRLLPFNPSDDALAATTYRWRLPNDGSIDKTDLWAQKVPAPTPPT